MSELVLPAPPQIVLPDFSEVGKRLRMPRWARPWERTKEDAVLEAATVVTTGGGGNVTTTSGGSLAVTITSPSSGNLLVVCWSGFNNISSISGGGVTTWSAAITALSGDTNHNDEDLWWGVVDGTPSTTVTISCTSTTFKAARVLEITGGSKVADASTAFANDSQSTSDSKSITTVTNGCVIVSVIGVHVSPTFAATGPTGYTQLASESIGGNGLGVAYLNQATAGASTMNWSALAGGSFPALGAVAIKPAATAASLVADPRRHPKTRAIPHLITR